MGWAVATFWVFVFIVGVASVVCCFFGVGNVYSSTCHVWCLSGLSWFGCGVSGVLGGFRWTGEESRVLRELVEQGLGAQQIYESGKLAGRTYEAIRRQVNLEALASAKGNSNVDTIEPASDAMKMEKVVKLFSTAFDQICQTQTVDKLALERFRIIFQAAKDYGPLLAGYEKWEKIEKRLDELSTEVAQLQAAKNASKA